MGGAFVIAQKRKVKCYESWDISDYQADLAAGIDEEDTIKPDRYKMKRGGFLSRHPGLKIHEKKPAQ